MSSSKKTYTNRSGAKNPRQDSTGSGLKSKLHARNRNREPYDLDTLIELKPGLKAHLKPNKYGTTSVDFANPKAVKLLNQALLGFYYGIPNWEFPEANLVPPIPGRADYLHYLADLLAESTNGKIPQGKEIKGLDIGTGASLIYPILGVVEYDWDFVATDIDPRAIASAAKIIENNTILNSKIELRLQETKGSIFKNVIKPGEAFDFSMCNPPFHATRDAATQGTRRKVNNLTGNQQSTPDLNFSGNQNELITPGGEPKFIKTMIRESSAFAKQCRWFTTLVSRQDYLKDIYKHLKRAEALTVKTIPMGTGNKISRIVAWSFTEKT